MRAMRPVVVLCALVLTATAAHADALAPSDLKWPSTTQSLRTRVAARVYDRAGGGWDDVIGKIAKGQRLAWKQIVAGKGRCKAWVEVEPYGWVCAKDLKASDDPPLAIPVPRDVKSGSDFAGIDLAASPPGGPFAWAVQPQVGYRDGKGTPGKPVNVRAAPDKKAALVRQLDPRTVVPVLETDGEFARIGDGEWVALTHLRVVRETTRPDGVGADERWIDVDLAQQTLVAYQGDTPVYATLISSGRLGTKTGIYRIRSKIAKKQMRDRRGRWDRPNTPFILYYREHVAIHAAYWHDGFGNAWSVGCVNLSAADARWVYDWATPVIPVGWSELLVPDGEGTAIRVRSERDPEPVWTDWKGKRIKKKG
jgi:lipoprotein-anchoring transpeptidase ErfK/SrfK